MVRRLANSRNVSRNDSSLSIPGRPNAAVNGILNGIAFSGPESQGLRALFAGFIDLYCETIPELRRAHLRNELRSMLVEMGVVPGLFFSEALGPVRLVSSQLLSNIVRQVLMKTQKPPDMSGPFVGQLQAILTQSRFRTEFEELETIGRGGFGQVYRVRSLLDKHQYAIKRIVARDEQEQLSQRILHEVQILAACQHPNIVRYHCGWIEIENIPAVASSSPSFTRRSVPRRERKDSPRIAIQEIFDSSESSDASQSVQVMENGGGGEGRNEESMTSMSSVGAVKKSPVGGKFWNGGDVSSEQSTVFSETSHSGAVAVPVSRRNAELSMADSSMEGAVVKKGIKLNGRFWNGDTSAESMDDESTDKHPSPVLATAIPLREKRGGEGDGEWRNGRENGESGKEVAVMQLNIRMVIFIQMELCTTTVEKFLLTRNEQLRRQSASVDGRESLSLFRQLMSAVEYIHEKGLIHRDIKPGNIFLKSDRRSGAMSLLLGDFGLSCLDGDDTWKEPEDNGAPRQYLVPSFTHSQGVGTTTYSAPEQLGSTKYGREVDLFSSGIVLLELFTVFGTRSEGLAVIGRLRERRELPEDVTAKWPSIASLVLRLTSPLPSDRPTSTAVLNELNDDASEIRSLQEMVSNQQAEIVALRKEVHTLKSQLARKNNRVRTGESHSSM
ncbi:hypothetical protein PRIPAC_74927 [Pristionchus pacificus]|nr:hypothetical protein PRIPAC_74927 [Pristionchus pacificus]